MRHLTIATSMTLAALSTGCLLGGEGAGETRIAAGHVESRVDDGSYRPILEAVTGRISGDVGPLHGLDHQATQLSAYDDGYYISIETVVALPDRAVMTLLSVSKGAELFKPGVSATFPLDASSGDTRVTVLGCVGQDVDVYDQWDKPADEVDLEVTAPDPGSSENAANELDVDVHARWYDRDQYGERLPSFHGAATTLTLTR